MATPHWIGANLGTWNTLANWSNNKDNSPASLATALPGAGDTVYLDKTHTGAFTINVNQDIGAISALVSAGSTGNWYLAGTSITVAGTAWNLTGPVTVTVPAGSFVGINNAITGGGTITKDGLGEFGGDGITTTNFGTSPINLNQGTLFNGVNNKLGTGKITMQAGTRYYNNVAGAISSQNPVDIRGDVSLGSSGTAGLFTITGAVDLDTVTRTLTVGSATSSVTISGPVTGTAGFTKSGAGMLTFSGSLAGLSGQVTLSAGNIDTFSAAYGVLDFNSPTPSTAQRIYVSPSVAGGYVFPAGFRFSGNGAVFLGSGNLTSVASGAGYEGH